MNPYYTSFTLGYEFKPVKSFGLEITYGRIVPKQKVFGEGNYTRFQAIGNIYRLEPKYYFKTIRDRDTLTSFFISIKLYKTDHDFISSRELDNEDGDWVRYNVNQKIRGVIPNLGMKHLFGNHFTVEYSVGVGKRWIESQNNFEGDESQLLSCWGEPHADNEKNGEIARWRININFKVGFAF